MEPKPRLVLLPQVARVIITLLSVVGLFKNAFQLSLETELCNHVRPRKIKD